MMTSLALSTSLYIFRIKSFSLLFLVLCADQYSGDKALELKGLRGRRVDEQRGISHLGISCTTYKYTLEAGISHIYYYLLELATLE